MSRTATCPNCTDFHVVDGRTSAGEGVYQSGCPNCGMLGADDSTPEGAAHRWQSFCAAMADRQESVELHKGMELAWMRQALEASDEVQKLRADFDAIHERAGQAERERDALIAAWPEREPCQLGESLVLPPNVGTDGPRMYGDRWPDVKRDIVRGLAGLEPDA